MDKEFKTTFIPKKRVAEKKNKNASLSRANSSILAMLALLLFVVALVSTLGVFFYKFQVRASNQKMIDSINRAEDAFSTDVIIELKKLDIRLKSGTELLNQHTALSDFFHSFADSTLPSVAFSDFSFELDDIAPRVSMSGEAKNYLAIAQQSQIFEENRYVENHIFSDFSLSENGHVQFALEFTLNRTLLNFGRIKENNDVEGLNSEKLIIPDQGAINSNSGLGINFN